MEKAIIIFIATSVFGLYAALAIMGLLTVMLDLASRGV